MSVTIPYQFGIPRPVDAGRRNGPRVEKRVRLSAARASFTPEGGKPNRVGRRLYEPGRRLASCAMYRARRMKMTLWYTIVPS